MSNPNPPNQWPVGVSGNPKGKPKDENSWAGLMRKVGDEVIRSGITKKEACVRVAFNEAAKGNFNYSKLLIERMDGPMAQELNVAMKTISIKPAPEPIEEFEDVQGVILPEASDESV